MHTHDSAYELRRATSGDHDAIAEIWHCSASLPGVGPPVMPTVEELRRRVGEEIAAGWKVTVAEQNGAIVGFAAVKINDAILDQLFVRPGHIGSGLGRALFKDCQSQMPEGFTLHTASSNETARRFYEKAGMQVLRQDSHPRTAHPVTYYVWNARL
jgi:putative acetyltransferase